MTDFGNTGDEWKNGEDSFITPPEFNQTPDTNIESMSDAQIRERYEFVYNDIKDKLKPLTISPYMLECNKKMPVEMWKVDRKLKDNIKDLYKQPMDSLNRVCLMFHGFGVIIEFV
jgi:hypothetical protein